MTKIKIRNTSYIGSSTQESAPVELLQNKGVFSHHVDVFAVGQSDLVPQIEARHYR
jgi:hypothetical protein